jgi:hypothetical protein
MDGKPLFRTFANNLKEHFLMPYYPMEDHLLRDVHCILIDNRDHSLRALKAKVQKQYDKLSHTEQFIQPDEMKQCLTDTVFSL